MNRRKKGTGLLLLSAIAALGMLLGACGADQPTGKTVQTQAAISTAGTPTAGLKACMACHPIQTAAWQMSMHANPNSSPSSTPSASCAPCHNQLGDRWQMTPNRNVIGCESCHGPGSLHADAGGTGPIGYTYMTSSVIGSFAVSAQFMTCTYCHEMLDSTGSKSAGPKTPGWHVTDPGEIIIDTHYATAGTWSYVNGSNMGSGVSGYAMDYNSDTVCTNCHNPHGTADVNREWLYSGHASTTAGNAWTFYNWSCDGTFQDGCGKSGPAINNRKTCQRCHTTTGFAAYADALRTGNTAQAGMISKGTASPAPVPYTQGTVSTGSYKSEMLHCNGCHTDNRGTLRNPGKYTAPYNITYSGSDKAVVSLAYPDASGSNICIACHTGRVSGESIKALNTTTTATVNFGNISTSTFASNFLPHDLTAAGVLFTVLGYEYSGRDYTNPASFRHGQIGSSAVPNTGTNGPCVGCHMYRTGQPGNHLFMPVSRTGNTITNVTSEVCYHCHAGSSSQLAEVLQMEEEEFLESLTVLNWALSAASFTPSAGFPPFSNTSWLHSSDTGSTAWTGNKTGKNNMGAAFNYEVLVGEPGAYVHNRSYTRRLIYDSIDWLDDRTMNYSTGGRLTTLCSVTACDKAKVYLLPFGVLPGSPAERP